MQFRLVIGHQFIQGQIIKIQAPVLHQLVKILDEALSDFVIVIGDKALLILPVGIQQGI